MVVLLIRRKRIGLLQLPLIRRNIREVSVALDRRMDAGDVQAVYQGQCQLINLAAADHKHFLVVTSLREGRFEVSCRNNTFHGPVGLPGQDD